MVSTRSGTSRSQVHSRVKRGSNERPIQGWRWHTINNGAADRPPHSVHGLATVWDVTATYNVLWATARATYQQAGWPSLAQSHGISRKTECHRRPTCLSRGFHSSLAQSRRWPRPDICLGSSRRAISGPTRRQPPDGEPGPRVSRCQDYERLPKLRERYGPPVRVQRATSSQRSRCDVSLRASGLSPSDPGPGPRSRHWHLKPTRVGEHEPR